MLDVKLVAIDLDGTLLDDQKRVSPENLHALERTLKRGVIVALATARDCASIMLKVPLTLPGLYLLGSGGALIYEVVTQSMIWSKYLSPPLVDAGVMHLKRYDYPVFLNDVNEYWVDRYNERVQMIEERYNLTTCPFQSPSDVQKPIMRVSLAAPAALLSQAADEAMQLLGDRLTVSLASPDWLDLLALQAGKGAAMEQLQSTLGISSTQSLAIGDYDCDLDLFAHAQHRIAMGNAVPSVKDAATFITAGNNESGVAQALEMFG